MNTAIVVPASTRLRYRFMDSSDAPLWFELDQDPEVMRYLNDGKPSTWEDIEQFLIPRVAGFTKGEKGHGLWEVSLKESGEYLGWILAREYGIDTSYHEPDNLELGWRLKRHCWGQGIATEAARSVARALLRADSSIRVVSAVADAENLASTGVMKKLGMSYIDNRIHHTPRRDFNCAYYEMPAAAMKDWNPNAFHRA